MRPYAATALTGATGGGVGGASYSCARAPGGASVPARIEPAKDCARMPFGPSVRSAIEGAADVTGVSVTGTIAPIASMLMFPYTHDRRFDPVWPRPRAETEQTAGLKRQENGHHQGVACYETKFHGAARCLL